MSTCRPWSRNQALVRLQVAATLFARRAGQPPPNVAIQRDELRRCVAGGAARLRDAMAEPPLDDRLDGLPGAPEGPGELHGRGELRAGRADEPVVGRSGLRQPARHATWQPARTHAASVLRRPRRAGGRAGIVVAPSDLDRADRLSTAVSDEGPFATSRTSSKRGLGELEDWHACSDEGQRAIHPGATSRVGAVSSVPQRAWRSSPGRSGEVGLAGGGAASVAKGGAVGLAMRAE